jgi:hypothetical protein
VKNEVVRAVGYERRKRGMNKNFGKQRKTHTRNMLQENTFVQHNLSRLNGPLVTRGTTSIASSSSAQRSPDGGNPAFHPTSCPSRSRLAHSYSSLSLPPTVTRPVKERQSTRMGVFRHRGSERRGHIRTCRMSPCLREGGGSSMMGVV